MPRSATSTVWSLAPSAGGCNRASATARLSAVRWWHSWCRVRSLGLRTSRPSTRYRTQPSLRQTATSSDVCGNVPPCCWLWSAADPAICPRRPRSSRAGGSRSPSATCDSHVASPRDQDAAGPQRARRPARRTAPPRGIGRHVVVRLRAARAAAGGRALPDGRGPRPVRGVADPAVDGRGGRGHPGRPGQPVIVVDASTVVAALLGAGQDGDDAREVMLGDEAHAPHLLDVEVFSAVRRQVLSGRLSAAAAGEAVEAIRELPVVRHGHDLLLDRALQLRDSITVYDRVYVALAELLEAPLATGDRRLSQAPGLRSPVSVIG